MAGEIYPGRLEKVSVTSINKGFWKQVVAESY